MGLLCLESDDGVIIQVGEVQSGFLLLEGGIRGDKKPSDVGKPKSTASIMRICGCFRVLVMNPVVSTPFEDGVLQSN